MKINYWMSEEALRRIQLIFQTEVKILKYPYPGLSYFSLKTARPLMEGCGRNPNCLSGLESLDALRIGRLPLKTNNNFRLVYLSILIMAYAQADQRLLRKVKNFAYDESNPLTCFPKNSIPEEFHTHYEDRLLRKLFVEFFHLVGSRRSSNRVLRFIQLHPILDLAFILLFKRLFVGCHPGQTAFSERYPTGDVIRVIFNKLQLTPNIIDGRLRIGENRYLAEDEEYVYMTYHCQDDIDMDFADEISDSESDQETNTTGNPQSTMKDSNCDSSNTKLTLEEESNRWVTPHKDDVMFQSTVIPRDNFDRLPGFVKSPTASETYTGKGKASLCMDEVELKYGEIKNKLRKLESDVENYNHPQPKQIVPMRMFPPLAFKERQSEKKVNNDCDTSFFRDRIASEVPTSSASKIPPQIPPLNSKTINLQNLHFPKKTQPLTMTQTLRQSAGPVQQFQITKNCGKIEQLSLQRISSAADRLSESRKIINEPEAKISASTSLLLKENPRKIFVRKI